MHNCTKKIQKLVHKYDLYKSTNTSSYLRNELSVLLFVHSASCWIKKFGKKKLGGFSKVTIFSEGTFLSEASFTPGKSIHPTL